MTRSAWERTITDSAGNVLTGVQITVFQSDGVTLATIYGQQSGGSALANPFNTGVQTSAKFYADAGRYVIRAFKDGLTKEFTDVDIAGRSVRDDIGTAAYLTATTSTTDVTQGRAMRSGDYGVGALAGPSELTPGAVRQNRMMSVSASWDGSPIAGVDAGNQGQMIHMQHGDPTYAVQILYSLLSSTGDLTRRISNNVVGPWARNITSANMVGTVAAQGGAPALFSAIIERGANSNGEYVKFADGTLICWGTPLVTATVLNNANAGAYGWSYYSDNNLVSFPAVFIAPPSVQATPQSAFLSAVATAIGVSSFLLIPITSISVASASPTTYMAIGRWR